MALLKARLTSRLVNLVLDAATSRLETHNTLFVYGCHGYQVAICERYKMASPATSRKSRKQNFSASEIAVLTEKVEENLSVLQSKLTNSVTNQKKNATWKKIADAVNAVGVAMRTVAEVREKWKNLHAQAKKEFTQLSKEQKQTGGGPAPKMPSTSTAKIIDLLKDTPSFTGLEGFESKGERISRRNHLKETFRIYICLRIVYR